MNSSWSDEDRSLLRTLGGHLSAIIHGEDLDVPDTQRRDELGILANMVSRVARELQARRRRDQATHRELTRRVDELQSAYETQEKLLSAIRNLPAPILEPYEGILLVPLGGPLDPTRVQQILRSLLDRAAAHRPEAVILHLAADAEGSDSIALLLRMGQSLRQAGTRPILSGVSSPHPPALSALTPCETLQEGLSAALDHLGYRITR